MTVVTLVSKNDKGMNRVIKFRVWNGSEMIYDVVAGKFGVFYVNPEDRGDGLHPMDSSSLTPFTTKFSDGTPVMQFTGLTDKNGKEIYEGDIIQCGGENEPMVVAWSDKYASFGIHRSGWMYMHFFGEAVDSTDCEVIGNIYQNPELINSKIN